MKRRLTVGIVGCGRMGRLHAEAYRRAGASVIGVADVHSEAAQHLARQVGATAYASHDELLGAQTLDCLSVCTPPAAHAGPALAAAASGVAVLCEKPLAQDVASARLLADGLESTGVPVMVGFFHHFHEPVVRLREMLGNGELGPSLVVRNRFSLQADDGRRPWRQQTSAAGGGAVMNTAIHSYALFSFLTGQGVAKVTALTARRWDPGARLEDTALTLLEGRTGDIGIVEAYEGAPFKCYELWAQGPEGEAVVSWDPPQLRVRTRLAADWNAIPVAARTALDRIDAGIQHFLRCVAEGRAPDRATLREGVAALRVAEAVYRSVEVKSSVELT